MNLRTIFNLSTAKWAVLACALMTALACGGGGGGGATGGGGGGGGSLTAGWTGGTAAKPQAGVYVEFQKSGQRVDPMNLKVGDTVDVVAANYSVFGVRTVLGASSYSISGGGTSVTLSSTGSLKVLKALSTKFTVTVRASLGSTISNYTQQGMVQDGTAVIGGKWVDSAGKPVSHLQVEFYSSTGAFVGAGQTNGDGQFFASVKHTAKFMALATNSVTTEFLRAAKYQGKNYSTEQNVCPIPVPAVATGGSVSLPANVLLVRQTDGPPAPPDDCTK